MDVALGTRPPLGIRAPLSGLLAAPVVDRDSDPLYRYAIVIAHNKYPQGLALPAQTGYSTQDGSCPTTETMNLPLATSHFQCPHTVFSNEM